MRLENIENYARATWENLVVEVPVSVYNAGKNAVVTVGGVVASAASLLTAGKIALINNKASEWTKASSALVSLPFVAVAKVLNPDFALARGVNLESVGVCSRTVRTIFTKAALMSREERFATREVLSRLTFLAGAVATVASRIADFAIGVLAASVSLACLGRWKAANSLAFSHLNSTRVVADLCLNLRGFVNPHQFFPKQEEAVVQQRAEELVVVSDEVSV